LLARRGRQARHDLEEAGAVAYAGHEGYGAAVENVHHSLGERFGPFLIEVLCGHVAPFEFRHGYLPSVCSVVVIFYFFCRGRSSPPSGGVRF